MKVVGGDFSAKISAVAMPDRFVFGDKAKGEHILYSGIEESQIQEETKSGYLVSFRFFDGRRLLAKLTEDEYLLIQGALFDEEGSIEDRRTETIDRSNKYKRDFEQRLLKEKRLKQIVFGVIVCAIIYSVGKPTPETAEQSSTASSSSASTSAPVAEGKVAKTESAPKRGVIADGAVIPLTKDQYPKAYKKWGKKGFDRINGLMPKAAELVVNSGTCDQLEVIDVSDRSQPPSNVVFFADCKNGNRFYVSEEDIASNQTLVSKGDQTAKYADGTMVQMCTDSTKGSLQYPSTFDADFGGTSIYRAPKGNVVVTIDFEAKNGMGNVLPHRSRCVFDDQGMYPPEISPR